MSRFDRVTPDGEGGFQHFYRGHPVRAPGAAQLCQNAGQQEEEPTMWGTVLERRIAPPHHRTADPDQALAALRQLAGIIDAAGHEFGPSKADSIAALKAVITGLPAHLVRRP